MPKIKVLCRNPEDYLRETKNDIHKGELFRKYIKYLRHCYVLEILGHVVRVHKTGYRSRCSAVAMCCVLRKTHYPHCFIRLSRLISSRL